jgi:hypothetical protein
MAAPTVPLIIFVSPDCGWFEIRLWPFIYLWPLPERHVTRVTSSAIPWGWFRSE